MTTEYELSKDDLRAFNLYHHSHSPTARRQYFRSWFVPAFVWLMVCAGLWYLADRERGTPLRTFLDLSPLFAGIPIYLIYFPWAYRRKLHKIIDGMVSEGRNKLLFSRHTVVLSAGCVTESGEFGQTSTVWRAVERVVRTDNYLFIYLNALAAIIVPRRAFTDVADFETFGNAARGFHANAGAA